MKVSLFIVGQPKSGTTALAQQLSLHPEITMASPKEPHFFATDLHRESDKHHGRQADFYIRTKTQYKNIFKKKPTTKIYGEASTGYLFSAEAAKNIHDHNPDAKIIISLRDPVDLLQSLHMQYVNETTEDETNLLKALEKEKERKRNKSIPRNVRTPSYLFYSERVKYAEQIKRYTDLFPPESILIFTAEDFRENNEKIYKKVLKMTGVDPTFSPPFTAVHESKAPRFKKLNSALHHPTLKKSVYSLLGPQLYTYTHKKIVDKILLKKQSREALSDSEQKSLRTKISPEVQKLERTLGSDLTKRWNY